MHHIRSSGARDVGVLNVIFDCASGASTTRFARTTKLNERDQCLLTQSNHLSLQSQSTLVDGMDIRRPPTTPSASICQS